MTKTLGEMPAVSIQFIRPSSFEDRAFSRLQRAQSFCAALAPLGSSSHPFAPLSNLLKQSSFGGLWRGENWTRLDWLTWQPDRLQLCEAPIPCIGLSIKRVVDVALSLIGLVVLWPLMLAIALTVKLESPGSALYRSLRVGKHGRTFSCFKFRTMIMNADKLKEDLRCLNQRHGPLFKIADDPRVTPLGRFLRKYSLDELPQLWNVVKGEMSLVGPRPHPIEDCAQYTSKHCCRLGMTPGMTGLWQVSGRRDPSFETSMTLDMAYIEKWSLLLDLLILLQTVPAVLAGEGQ